MHSGIPSSLYVVVIMLLTYLVGFCYQRSCLEKAEKASTYAVNIVGYHTTNNLLIMTYLTSNHRIKKLAE